MYTLQHAEIKKHETVIELAKMCKTNVRPALLRLKTMLCL